MWQKWGKNHAILELFLGNSSWQIDERQNLCAPRVEFWHLQKQHYDGRK